MNRNKRWGSGRARVARTLLAVALALPAAAGAWPADAPSGTADRPAVDAVTAWLTQLEGVWAGSNNRTPLGTMPFALVFDRQADGSLNAHTALNGSTWVDLDFHRTGSEPWVLTESAALQGVGQQSHDLVATVFDGHEMTWVEPQVAGFLAAKMAQVGDALTMTVWLRGEEHVHFELARLTGEAAAALRARLTAAALAPTPAGPAFPAPSAATAAPQGSGGARGSNSGGTSSPRARYD